VINDAALDLLDLPADEQHLLHRELDPLLARRAPLDDLVAVLDRRGLAPGTRRTHLAPVDHAGAVSATALAWVGRLDDVPELAARHRDLLALAADAAPSADEAGPAADHRGTAERVADGRPAGSEPAPLWARVARAASGDADLAASRPVSLPVVEPQPALLTISRAQEQVVAASREHPLAIALGAPGSGKSHAVINVALTAVALGDRALVIAPDRHLAAALHEQLRSVHPGAFPLLALGARSRAPLGRAIDRALRHPVDGFDDLELAEAAWSRAAGRIRPTYARHAARESNERTLADALADQDALGRQLLDLLATPPAAPAPGADPRTDPRTDPEVASVIDPAAIDHGRLVHHLPGARDAVQTWAAAAGRGPRDRFDRRTARRQARRSVEPLLGTVDGELRERWRTAIERDDLAGVVDGAELLDRYLTAVSTVDALRTELEARPDAESLATEIDASYAARLGPSVSLSRARWAARLEPRANGRVSARRFQLAVADQRGTGAEARTRARDLRVDAETLDAFPLWVATPDGASTFLPLIADLFDVVVIDGAHSIDVGRGLPLLARARRAVLVGQIPQERPVGHGCSTILDAGLVALDLAGGTAIRLDAPYRPPAPVAAYIAEHVTPAGEPDVAPSSRRAPASPALAWLDHAGGFSAGPGGRSGRNAGEAIAVVELVAELLAGHRVAPPRRPDDDTIELRDVAIEAIAVVAPLSAHRAVLRDVLRERFGGRVTVVGFDELAGLERDIIVVAPAIGPDAPDDLVAYATDREALAATLGRARSRVVVVGDRSWFAAGTTALAPLARTAPVVQPAALAHRAAG
jgi:hypothetical protein